MKFLFMFYKANWGWFPSSPLFRLIATAKITKLYQIWFAIHSFFGEGSAIIFIISLYLLNWVYSVIISPYVPNTPYGYCLTYRWRCCRPFWGACFSIASYTHRLPGTQALTSFDTKIILGCRKWKPPYPTHHHLSHSLKNDERLWSWIIFIFNIKILIKF